MNHDFWSKSSKRLDNPTLKSTYLTNILSHSTHQQLPSKTDFDRPIRISERPNDFIKRSYSELPRHSLSLNPEKTSPMQQKMNIADSTSRMSNFGSSSLSKLQRLDSDIDVYSKQRRDRGTDIISQEPRLYRDVIKVFPKYRYETLDQDYWRRKSFIEGMPRQAFNHYSSNKYIQSSSKIASINKLSTASLV